MRTLGPLTVCALWAVARSRPGSAEPVRRIAVVTLPASLGEREAAQMDHDLAEWTRAEARLELVEIDVAGARETEARKAGALLDAATRKFDTMELSAATSKSAQAIGAFEASDLSKGIDGLQNALALHAWALLAAGNKSEAGEAIARIITLKAAYKLEPERLSRKAARLVEEARAAASATQTSVLEISASPVPASAYLDGVFLGITPVKAEALRPGSHYVTLVAKGYELAQEKIVVGSVSNSSLVLKPTKRGLEFFALRAGLHEQPSSEGHEAELAQWAGVDEVLVFARVQGPGAIYAAFSASKDGRATAVAQRRLAAGEEPTAAAIALAKVVLFPD